MGDGRDCMMIMLYKHIATYTGNARCDKIKCIKHKNKKSSELMQSVSALHDHIGNAPCEKFFVLGLFVFYC